jgi:hypothetical protein
MAREAVKLALIRRDTRRIRQFRFPYHPRKMPISRQQSCDILPDSWGSVIRFINVRLSEGLTTGKTTFT